MLEELNVGDSTVISDVLDDVPDPGTYLFPPVKGSTNCDPVFKIGAGSEFFTIKFATCETKHVNQFYSI